MSNHNNKWTRKGFEQKAAALHASFHEARLDTLRNVGNVETVRVQQSAKDKYEDPRRRRKNWRNDTRNEWGY